MFAQRRSGLVHYEELNVHRDRLCYCNKLSVGSFQVLDDICSLKCGYIHTVQNALRLFVHCVPINNNALSEARAHIDVFSHRNMGSKNQLLIDHLNAKLS